MAELKSVPVDPHWTAQDAIRQVLQEAMFDGIFVSECVEV